jgi:DnaK suppressor protein
VDAERLTEFKKLLTERRAAVVQEAARVANDLPETPDAIPDELDIAAVDADREAMIRIADRDRQLLSQIDEALRRIEDGHYGICGDCGETISERRLMVQPMATQCIDCKTLAEEAERGRRPF